MFRLFVIVVTYLLAPNVIAGTDLDAAAKDVCKCLEKPYAEIRNNMQLINKAQASGNMSELISAQGKMMGVMNASTECFDGLSRKYPEVSKNETLQNQVMDKANKRCPNPADKFLQN